MFWVFLFLGAALLKVGGDDLKKAIAALHESHGDLAHGSGKIFNFAGKLEIDCMSV